MTGTLKNTIKRPKSYLGHIFVHMVISETGWKLLLVLDGEGSICEKYVSGMGGHSGTQWCGREGGRREDTN